MMKVNLIFKWFDFWIGLFWDQKKRWLYFFPIPCIGLVLKFKNNAPGIETLDQKRLPGFGESPDGFIDWMETHGLEWESGRNESLILINRIHVKPGQLVSISPFGEIQIKQ